MNPAATATDRYVLTTDLRDDPGVAETYREYHANVPAEVTRSFSEAGIRELEVYLLGRRLVMIVEIDRGLDLDRAFRRHASSHPRVAEWEALMARLQRPIGDAPRGEWWARMERVCRIAGPSAADGRRPPVPA